MANSAQARKRARQSQKNRAHNASLRTAFRTAVKKVLKVCFARKICRTAVRLPEKYANPGKPLPPHL